MDLYLYPVIKELTKEEEEKAITLIFMAELGSGKTTLLNSYINYIMGINYEDDFRYILINDQSNKFNRLSETSDVNIYNIKIPDGKIFQIVDTPGFGDSLGIKKDIEISKKIRQIIIDKLSSITCICFVNKACTSRLTINQKYVFTLSSKDAQIVTTCKAQVSFTFDDFGKWVSLRYGFCFMIF